MLIETPMFIPDDIMTVSDLITILQHMPGDAPVITEGCDCNAYIGKVILGTTSIENTPTVFIRREF